MQEYVAGFYFTKTPSGHKVTLIRKRKPQWQAGKLNGIGGKIEPSDRSSHEAMAREFKEEATKEVKDWELFCCLEGKDFRVSFFRAFGSRDGIQRAEKEHLECHWVWNLLTDPEEDMIENLYWLIPAALEGVYLGTVIQPQ